MEFGTWYQINCETEHEWANDFAIIKDTGFDFVVLWNVSPEPWDMRQIVYQPEKTLRALTKLQKAGLGAYLGVWNPTSMGNVPVKYRPRGVNGISLNRPNIFNLEWLSREWKPYVESLAKLFGSHKAYRGAYFDDSFSTHEDRTTYWSYTDSDKRRFRQWLQLRYLTISNLNMKYRQTKKFHSFNEISPPLCPDKNLALWTDWMDARSDWCEDFARVTREAYRSIDTNARHHLVLSDYDHYMHRNFLHHGVDYNRLMSHFDRFEIYMADDHRKIGKNELLANARYNVELGCKIAGRKPFQFHTWFADPFKFTTMKPEVLKEMIECATSNGADVIEIYTFKVHDWRNFNGTEKLVDGRPPLKEVSLKYNPKILKKIKQIIAGYSRFS